MSSSSSTGERAASCLQADDDANKAGFAALTDVFKQQEDEIARIQDATVRARDLRQVLSGAPSVLGLRARRLRARERPLL